MPMRLAAACALVLAVAAACTTAEAPAAATATAPGAGEPGIGEAASDAAMLTPPAPAPPEPDGLGFRTLVIGTDATYPPFESMTEQGTIEGVDPSLMAAICELASCVPEFQNTAWDGIFAALGAGEFDVLMSAITILPEREADSNATFTKAYFEVGQVILKRGDDTAIAGPDDLSGDVKVGVQTGTTGDTAATEGLGVPTDNIVRFETVVLAVQALLNGDVDAVVLDNPTAEIFVGQHADDLEVAGEAFTTEQYGILVPNSAPEVLAALNSAIDTLQETGRIDEIVGQWYQVDEAADGG
ncbi:MAG: transporter substrate-binding domain-containing protein [Anaerolineae bacterium]